jgi:AraC family transcriptional regulator of adaptative response/methylated-DNA-[protein]-cysteine methyltransferase
MTACATNQGICLLEFSDRSDLETYVQKLSHSLKAILLPGSNVHLDQLQEQVSDYFQGQRKNFNLKLFTPGTDFQNSVWKALQGIPYGETRTYSQQAQLINKPQSIRAVASANGKNRIAIVIPCHRVIGKDGNLRGYAGGVTRKKWLLEFENPSPNLFD